MRLTLVMLQAQCLEEVVVEVVGEEEELLSTTQATHTLPIQAPTE